MVLSCLIISRYFFLYSVDQLENMEIDHANQQALSVVDLMVSQQSANSYDWAYWDETYDLFLDKPDIAGYTERNLYLETLNSLNLDMMSFVTFAGQQLLSLTREESADKSSALSAKVVHHPYIQQHIAAMNHKPDAHRTQLSGLVKIDQTIWGLSLTPVKNSSSNRASNGWLLWGRNLSARFPGDFASVLSAPSSLIPLVSLLPENTPKRDIDKSAVTITKSSLLNDLGGSPIAWVETEMKREYFSKGNALFLYLFATVGVVASIIAAVTFFIFKNKVAIRFNHFADDMHKIASEYKIDGTQSITSDELELASKLVQKLSDNTSTTQLQLKDSMHNFSALYNSSSLGMLFVIEREIVDANPRALEMLNHQKADLINRPLNTLCSHDDGESRLEEMLLELANGKTLFEAQVLDSHGDTIDCLIEAALIQHDGQSALMLLIQDIRETKQQAEMIQRLTDFDPVSGFCNRPSIMEALDNLVKTQPNRFSFIFLKSKQLKQLAEVYGHHVCDEAVQHLSKLLREALGQYKIGRISEYEFIIIIPDETNHQDVIESTNHLLKQLSYKAVFSDITVSLNSKAVMMDPKITHQPVDHLLMAARHSAQSLRGQQIREVFLTGEALSEQAEILKVINRDLEAAIQQGEITPYYQPIVDAKSEEVIGFEALARWQHPELGTVSPTAFIPVAEQGKLIIELGESILKQSCAFLGALNQERIAKGLPQLSVHINLSARHFYHSELISYLTTLIEEYQISAGNLVLEITESMLVGSETESINCINEIKRLGVQLALDDFGTGYSSFSSICNFPLDIVKLDKSYIDEIERNDRAKTLVRNIVSMSQELGLTIVAEGVETASQVRKLKVWNINDLQGFYFYKPMKKDEALEKFSGKQLH
ncbi:EAL domain-containing protein [Vibrio sp. EA2]|uniref:bifunctional diguanylate cyclase/phosphodiesterase n=1 Tax=Vibrio sp. EA2 TaxID=3079860 RepID=UPI002948E549|nr:EAL domain-containing protein [Vibrio sp. EA2]MDV6249927.1 EAL domain-containing protein [Vibrio sp. EA2]